MRILHPDGARRYKAGRAIPVNGRDTHVSLDSDEVAVFGCVVDGGSRGWTGSGRGVGLGKGVRIVVAFEDSCAVVGRYGVVVRCQFSRQFADTIWRNGRHLL